MNWFFSAMISNGIRIHTTKSQGVPIMRQSRYHGGPWDWVLCSYRERRSSCGACREAEPKFRETIWAGSAWVPLSVAAVYPMPGATAIMTLAHDGQSFVIYSTILGWDYLWSWCDLGTPFLPLTQLWVMMATHARIRERPQRGRVKNTLRTIKAHLPTNLIFHHFCKGNFKFFRQKINDLPPVWSDFRQDSSWSLNTTWKGH